MVQLAQGGAVDSTPASCDMRLDREARFRRKESPHRDDRRSP
jgi:hypothetical protein